jgi:hypothetical protein
MRYQINAYRIMQIEDKIKAQYEANKVSGRSQWCPRIGFYEVVSTYSGTWLNKPARMAIVNWKSSASESFALGITFHIQIESLLLSNPGSTFDESGKEFKVTSAQYVSQVKMFMIKWEFIPKKTTVDELNKLLSKNMGNINFDDLIDLDLDDNQFGDFDFEEGY